MAGGETTGSSTGSVVDYCHRSARRALVSPDCPLLPPSTASRAGVLLLQRGNIFTSCEANRGCDSLIESRG